MNITELLQLPESKTLEYKRNLTSPDGVLRSIVAFANTAGGTIIVGVEDKTKNICGVNDPLLTEERIANLVSDNIYPRIVPDIEIIPWRKTHVIAIKIYPSSNRPHYIKKLGLEKGVYVRIGSTNRLADQLLVSELRRFILNESFDERAFPELNYEDFDFIVASELFAELTKLNKSSLESLGLITKYQNKYVPTVAGVILFCKNRRKFFPDAWIQIAKFAGGNKQHISEMTEIHSYPILAIEEAIKFIYHHMPHSFIEIGMMKREEHMVIPKEAIREAVINAVVHADYEQHGAPIRISIFADKLEIENPGLLLFGLTIDDICRGVSKLRNRIIGRIFSKLKLIEHLGSGIQRIISVCENIGLKKPLFEEIGTHFRVTLYFERLQIPKLDNLDTVILDAVNNSSGLSTSKIAKITGISVRSARNRMISLIARGLIVEVGTSSRDPRRVYLLKKNI